MKFWIYGLSGKSVASQNERQIQGYGFFIGWISFGLLCILFNDDLEAGSSFQMGIQFHSGNDPDDPGTLLNRLVG
jgi:hypothetical protein